jgi:hypothetical protein
MAPALSRMAESGIGEIYPRAGSTSTSTHTPTGLAKTKQTGQLSQTSTAIRPLTLWSGLMKVL